MRDATLQIKKLFRTSSFMYFAFILSEGITITSSEGALKVCKHNFFQEIYDKSIVTCNLPIQWRFIWVKFLHVKYDRLSNDRRVYIEWQQVVQQVTRNDNKWYNEWQRVVQRGTTSGKTSDNEWQWMTTSDS